MRSTDVFEVIARHLRRNRLRAALAMALLALASPPRAFADIFSDATVGAVYDSNLTQAEAPADVRADIAATLAGSVSWYEALTGNDGLTLSLDAHSDLYHRFHGLNDIDVAGAVNYRHKFGLGWSAPWISVAASLGYDDFSSQLRDGARLYITAEAGKRFTEDFAASLGAVYDRRYATADMPVVPDISGRVFATLGTTAFVRAAYDITDRVQVAAKLSVRRGDVVSTTRPDRVIFLASEAIAADPTFGPDFFAYRLRGTTATASATLSVALSERSSVNLGYAAARTRATQGFEYQGGITDVSLTYRF